MTMGDRIVIMKDGLINQIDTPINIYNNPVNKFVAGFIGSPSMNFINGKIIKRDELLFQSEKGEIEVAIPESLYLKLGNYEDRNIVLGIRPEHISLELPDLASVKISITIEVIELLGNEIFIYFNVEGMLMTGRLDSTRIPEQGKKIDIYLYPEKLKFFDPETNVVI
jgi:multiple sugar transport system ATP-binding protein